jgi:hypothetical protein
MINSTDALFEQQIHALGQWRRPRLNSIAHGKCPEQASDLGGGACAYPHTPDTALSSASSASEVTISMRHTCLLAQLATIALAPVRHGTASS